jgi:hypothetical protein
MASIKVTIIICMHNPDVLSVHNHFFFAHVVQWNMKKKKNITHESLDVPTASMRYMRGRGKVAFYMSNLWLLV